MTKDSGVIRRNEAMRQRSSSPTTMPPSPQQHVPHLLHSNAFMKSA
jgi:hypothetical protein